MDFNKFKINFSFVMNIILFVVFIFGGLIYADSNGVWHRAEDVRAGVFGSDEITGTDYTFPNNLNVTSNVNVGQNILIDGNTSILGNTNIGGELNVMDSVIVGQDVLIKGNTIVTGDAEINGSLCIAGDCHSNWASICEQWVLNNSIN